MYHDRERQLLSSLFLSYLPLLHAVGDFAKFGYFVTISKFVLCVFSYFNLEVLLVYKFWKIYCTQF